VRVASKSNRTSRLALGQHIMSGESVVLKATSLSG
jgi:hypothetical protein